MCWGERDKQFEGFARRYKVVYRGMRGFGNSDVPTDQSYARANDLKVLLDYLEIVSANGAAGFRRQLGLSSLCFGGDVGNAGQCAASA